MKRQFVKEELSAEKSGAYAWGQFISDKNRDRGSGRAATRSKQHKRKELCDQTDKKIEREEVRNTGQSNLRATMRNAPYGRFSIINYPSSVFYSHQRHSHQNMIPASKATS